MSKVVGAETTQMHATAQAMARSYETLHGLLSQARSGMQQLQSTQWSGRHRTQAEEYWSTLMGGIDPAAGQIEQLARGLERVAAALDQAGERFGIQSNDAAASVCEDTTPPPRIYIINGIDSQTKPGQVNSMSEDLKELLRKRGYENEDILALDAIYHAPLQEKEVDKQKQLIDNTLQPIMPFLPIGIPLAINAAYELNKGTAHLASQAYGAREVMNEYVQKEKGRYSQQVLQRIKDDIDSGNLKKGQKIVLIGHSGGGVVMTNIVEELEKKTNSKHGGMRVDVEAVVPLGSPVANADAVSKYAKVLSINHKDDSLGRPHLRSDEMRKTISTLKDNPLAAFSLMESERMSRDKKENIIYKEIDDGITKKHGPHGSYRGSEQTIDLIRENIPSTQQKLRPHKE